MPTWCKVVLAVLGILIGIQIVVPIVIGLVAVIGAGVAGVVETVRNWIKGEAA